MCHQGKMQSLQFMEKFTTFILENYTELKTQIYEV